ncbi:MAG TPA: PD-(D/E)XK nuclease family protein [Pyrinomonadaceae bacterium]
MSKQIWLGPLLGTNRSRLIERCAELVSKGDAGSFLYLAASQPLLELVTEGIVDGQTNRGLWGELPVYLFRGFVRQLLATTIDSETRSPLPPRVPIDREELPLKRSLISQILKQLRTDGRLSAIAPLVGSDGCVTTIATLIGEIQRAGKTPAELDTIVAARAAEFNEKHGDETAAHSISLQVDFDREVALIYATYTRLLEQHGLTEDDANGLRALQILLGELDGKAVQVPWLDKAQLLILDGFFDFTPVQGEMLRLLIPRFPVVLVNLNHDVRNREIFKPFEDTIEQLCAIADFELVSSEESELTKGALAPLRASLFNSQLSTTDTNDTETVPAGEIHYRECTNRETEIRTIAKEIKQLLLAENYQLSEIALVVRERESYAETISRVMRDESLPCNLNRRIVAGEIPATRAVLKLLAVLDELARDSAHVLRMPQLADQIKSGYFRLAKDEIESLATEFDSRYSHLLSEDGVRDPEREKRRRRDAGVGYWDADALENIIAYVGAELRLPDWLDRCRQLIEQLPGAAATKELLNIDTVESNEDDEDTQVEDAETIQKEDRHLEKKRRPHRDVNPAAIAWATLVIKRFATHIQSVPRQGQPVLLRAALMKLLGQFQFRTQVTKPVRHTEVEDLPRTTLDLHALEALRRAFVSTIKSIQFTSEDASAPIDLTTFIDELRRCLSSQNLTLGNAERGGLQVLAATDVRGLRFRALFVAGLVEGGFPLAASRDWIYPHEERERLKRYGLVLEDISPETLLKEEHYFYQVVCRATERLYLSRPLLLEADKETVASYYIEELRRAIAPASMVTQDVVRPDYDGRQIEHASSARELTIGLIRNEQRHLVGPDKVGLRPKPQVNSLLSLARNDGFLSASAVHRMSIERERCGPTFGPYDGQITDPNLLKLISHRFGPDCVHSASGLSTFGSCPYRFFAQRVLKLEPRGEAALDLQALDAGKLLHDILRRFFERYRGARFDASKRDELVAELLDIADEVFDQHQRVVPPLNRQIWKLDRAIRKIILEQVFLFELDMQEKTSLKELAPVRFELAFGGTQSSARDPDSVDIPLQLTRSSFVGEELMKISGQIDRVDMAADQTVVAYDYKLSKGARREDMLSGRSLQIPIYLEALEQIFFPNHQVAGGGYYTLRGGTDRRNTGMYRAALNDYLNLKTNTRALVADSDYQRFRTTVIELVWTFLDRMRAGEFKVDPSQGYKTCRFCDYKAVCRYDRFRIQQKKWRKAPEPTEEGE